MPPILIVFPVSRLAGLAFLLACGVLATGCDAALQDEVPAVQAAEPAFRSTAPSAAPSGTPAAPEQTSRFAVEEALGAECRANWNGEPPLQGAACYGSLPEHLASLLRNIPEDHPYLSTTQREEAAAGKHWYRAVKGYGERADFVVSLASFGDFWIRSFEGPDPATTVYVVYGPSCIDSPDAPLDMECLEGAPATIRELKVYRVRNDGPPEDVTRDLAPPPPHLTPAERRRYGIYLRPQEEGGAEDADIGLDVRRLSLTPVMRWVIDPAEEGDYEKPKIPDSDPRGFLGVAHFAFLVWTGERFELREKIPFSLWACGLGPVVEGDCMDGHRSGLDPYLIDDVESITSGDGKP